VAAFLRCAPDSSGQVFLDEAEHFRHNRSASVATLRGLFAFGPELLFTFPSESVFTFAGIRSGVVKNT